MLLREKKEYDIEELAKVHYESWLSTYKGIIPESYLDEITLESYIENHYKFNAPCIVAEIDNKIVGFLMYAKDKDDDTSENCGEILVIYLLEAYQNQGVGTQLMIEAEKKMKQEYDQLSLWVIEDNLQAVNFYEKCGFKKDEKVELSEHGVVLRETRMIKDL